MHIIPAAIAWLFQVEINGSYKQEEKVIHSEISMVKHIFYSIGAFYISLLPHVFVGKGGCGPCALIYIFVVFSLFSSKEILLFLI